MQSIYDKATKQWSVPKEDTLYDADCSIGNMIYQNMKNFPNKICQISDIDGVALTNREALTTAIRIAQHFKKMGLGHEDIVGISAKNSTYLMTVAIACFLNCTPFHAVNPMQDDKTQTAQYARTKPKIIFCDGNIYNKIQQITVDLKPKIFTLTGKIEGVSSVHDLLEPTETELFYKPETLLLGGQQTAAILCSSGTSGTSKPGCITHRKLFLDMELLNNEDVLFSISSLDWVSGIVVLMLSLRKSCTRIITDKPLSSETLLHLVKKYKITYILMAPFHAATFCKETTESLPSVRLISLVASGASLATLKTLQSRLPNGVVSFGYGFTEITGWVSANFNVNKITSVGKLRPGLKARIVDDSGNKLGPNELGEVLVHDSVPWTGYFGDAKLTAEMCDAQGWFHTGDMGYFDAEHYLYIVDRKKDILKYQGQHYSPVGIEKVIAELPGVVNVCVVGVDDGNENEAAGALVIKAVDSDLCVKDIMDYVQQKLEVDYKQLHAGVVFVDKLPQNTNGKTIRKDAKSLFVENYLKFKKTCTY